MPSTTNFGLILPASEQDREKVATYNQALIDADGAVGGQLSRSVAGSSNVTLTRAEALHAFFVFTGVLTGNIQVAWPASGGSARNLRVYNATTGAFSLTLVVAGGSGVAITQGEIRDFAIDGTTVRPTNATAGTYTQTLAQSVWARVTHSATQSLTNNTLTAISFDTERADTDTIHDNVTNNTRLTCKTAGVYLIKGSLGYAANATGERATGIRLNGTTYLEFVRHNTNSISGAETRQSIGSVYALAVNDYVELIGFQTSGGALNTEKIGNYSPEFMMIRLGG